MNGSCDAGQLLSHIPNHVAAGIADAVGGEFEERKLGKFFAEEPGRSAIGGQ